MDDMKDIELTLDNDELLQLCLMAHKRDITLNALVTDILTEQALPVWVHALHCTLATMSQQLQCWPQQRCWALLKKWYDPI